MLHLHLKKKIEKENLLNFDMAREFKFYKN